MSDLDDTLVALGEHYDIQTRAIFRELGPESRAHMARLMFTVLLARLVEAKGASATAAMLRRAADHLDLEARHATH